MYKKTKQYRLPNFDYSSNWCYFITIVCANRIPYLGSIANSEMTLSDIGEIVNQNIQNVSAFKDDVLIQKSVIMPNHIHLIIELKNESKSAEPPQSQSKYGHLSPLKKGSLGSFVNHFKGKITRTCRENGLIDFKWQARFHDRIIRDEEEYNRIYYYIEHNVKNWERDKEHPLNNQK